MNNDDPSNENIFELPDKVAREPKNFPEVDSNEYLKIISTLDTLITKFPKRPGDVVFLENDIYVPLKFISDKVKEQDIPKVWQEVDTPNGVVACEMYKSFDDTDYDYVLAEPCPDHRSNFGIHTGNIAVRLATDDVKNATTDDYKNSFNALVEAVDDERHPNRLWSYEVYRDNKCWTVIPLKGKSVFEQKAEKLLSKEFIEEVMLAISINEKDTVDDVFKEYAKYGVGIPKYVMEHAIINGVHGDYFLENYGQYVSNDAPRLPDGRYVKTDETREAFFEMAGRIPEEVKIPNKPKKPGLIIAVGQDERDIAHFHVFKTKNDWKNWVNGACLFYDKNAYFDHGRHKETLDRDELNAVVHSLNSQFDGLPITNWQHIVALWNSNNYNHKIDPNTKMPEYDYDTIKRYAETKENKQ